MTLPGLYFWSVFESNFELEGQEFAFYLRADVDFLWVLWYNWPVDVT